MILRTVYNRDVVEIADDIHLDVHACYECIFRNESLSTCADFHTYGAIYLGIMEVL